MAVVAGRCLIIASWRPPPPSRRRFSSTTFEGVFRALSECPPVAHLQDLVVDVHVATGMPWWATVVATTVFLRTAVTVPLAVHQHYIMAKVQNVQREMDVLADELKAEVVVAAKMYGWDERTAKYHFRRSLKKQWNALIVRDNCHPVKASLLIWFQIPLWVCFSATVRNLVYALPETNANALAVRGELMTGGFGWISDLTVADSTLVLPLLLGLINLSIVELQALSRTGTAPPSRLQRHVLAFFRCFGIALVPIAAYVPSCLALYWTTSSFYGLVQNVALMSPRVRRLCRIPRTVTEPERPYQLVIDAIGRKIGRK